MENLKIQFWIYFRYTKIFLVIFCVQFSIYPIISACAQTVDNELKKVDHRAEVISGISFNIASSFERVGEAGDESRKVVLYASPKNMADPSYLEGILRVKVISKSKEYTLNSELKKLEEEWNEFHHVKLATSFVNVYKLHPLEKRNNKFALGVGNIVAAQIVSNPREFTLFSYVAESDNQVILISLFSRGKNEFEIYKRNRLAFELVSLTVP